MSDPGKNKQRKDGAGRIETSDREQSNDSSTDITSSFNILGNELNEYMDRKSLGYHVYPGAERIIYDFTAERLNMDTLNLVESTKHLIKGCLGSGILCMHVGFMYGGLWTSLVATSVSVAVVSYCMLMLVKSAQKMYVKLRIPKLTYPDLVEVAVATGPWKPLRRFSKTFRHILDSMLYTNMCVTCCVYEIMIAVTVKQAIESVSPTMKDNNINIRYYILMITVPLIVLCLIRNLKYLAPFSLAADVFIVSCIVTTVYYSIAKADSIHNSPAWKSVHGLLRFSGICLFSIDGVGVSLSVENNMRKPKYFFIVLQYGMSIVMICMTLTGFLGYWGWGEKSEGPITIHMPANTVTIILQFLMAISLSVTFAVQLWVPFRIAWHYIVRRHKSKSGIWERFYRIVHVSLITCASVAFPNKIKLMIFMGNFFLAFTIFVFPAFIESQVTWYEPHGLLRWRLIKNCLLILFGVVLSGATLYSLLDI